ncbi:MAG TPA: hypothetical protein VI564_05020 [Candidatus Nanoarchaeia archaeon]|nr:hypothetical protein [Candidatus Nanoarchaeia archaeon]
MFSRNKKIIFSFILILVILISACKQSQEQNNEATFSSPDGKLKINFGDSGIPEGVSAKDVSAADISSDVAASTPEELKNLVKGAYRLEPEGAKFKEPVEVVIEYKMEQEDSLPLIYHLSDGSFEIVDYETSEIKDGNVEIKAHVTHFSELILVSPPFILSFDGLGIYAIGESFPFSVNIRKGDGDKYERIGSTIGIRNKEEHPWIYIYGFLANSKWEVKDINLKTTDSISPQSATIKGASVKNWFFEGKTTYRCESEFGSFVKIPDGITVSFVLDRSFVEEEEPMLAAYKTDEPKKYRITAKLPFNLYSLRINCKLPEGKFEKVDAPVLCDPTRTNRLLEKCV